jgi:hypothetical protein
MSHPILLTHAYEHKNQRLIELVPKPTAATFFIDRGIVEEPKPVQMETAEQDITTARRKRHAAIHPLGNPLNASDQEALRYVPDQLQQARDSGIDVGMNGPQSAPLMVSSTVHEAIRRMRNGPEDELSDEENSQAAPGIPARPLLKRRNAVRLPFRDAVNKLMETQSFPPPSTPTQLRRHGAIRAKKSSESTISDEAKKSGLLPVRSVHTEQWPKLDRAGRPFSFVDPEERPEKAIPSMNALVMDWLDQVEQPQERSRKALPPLDAAVKSMLTRMHLEGPLVAQDQVQQPKERPETPLLCMDAAMKPKKIVTREQVEDMPTGERLQQLLRDQWKLEKRPQTPFPSTEAPAKPTKMLTREEFEKLTRVSPSETSGSDI